MRSSPVFARGYLHSSINVAINDVVSELNRIKLSGLISDYAIGGAVAAQAYIETSATEDVDVFVVFSGGVANSLAPLSDVWSDLIAHGAKVEGQYLIIGGWPVQLLPPGTPLYDEAIAQALSLDFGGNFGKVMRPEHLAAIALQTGRSKDYQRVSEFIRNGSVQVEAIQALINRFGLTDRWALFLTRFPLGDADV